MTDKIIEAPAKEVPTRGIPLMPECWIVRWLLISDDKTRVVWATRDFHRIESARAFAAKQIRAFIIHVEGEESVG